MDEIVVFNYERFLSLTGSELSRYVEPFVNNQSGSIPANVFDLIQSRLLEMDVEHTVYSLEICMLLNPYGFIRQAIVFLSHADAAVCCAAYRVINSIPVSTMPSDIAALITAVPIVNLFGPDLRSGKHIQIGTNKVFISALVAKFVSSPDSIETPRQITTTTIQ